MLLGPAPVIVNMCRWPGTPEYDRNKLIATFMAWLQGAQPTEPLRTTIILTQGVLDDDINGLYDPVTRNIYIAVGSKLDLRFYYTVAHEMVHAVYDQRHVPWDVQHCRMYTSDPILNPMRALLQKWAPGVMFEDPIRTILACAERGAE